MHTLTLTVLGFVLLFVFVFIANSIKRRKGKPAAGGARLFIWFWLVVSLIDFYVGVFVANHPVMMEVGVHIIIFGLPAGLAWYLSRRF